MFCCILYSSIIIGTVKKIRTVVRVSIRGENTRGLCFLLFFNIVQAEQLAAMVLTAGEEVSAGAARRAKLRAAASAAVRVLELTEKDIGPNLAILLRQVDKT